MTILNAPTLCPRCSSKPTRQEDDFVRYLCGTESTYDVLEGWGHDWDTDANAVCQEFTRLRDELAAYNGVDALVAQLSGALAFAQSVIKCGEPWTSTCEEQIGGALTAARIRL